MGKLTNAAYSNARLQKREKMVKYQDLGRSALESQGAPRADYNTLPTISECCRSSRMVLPARCVWRNKRSS